MFRLFDYFANIPNSILFQAMLIVTITGRKWNKQESVAYKLAYGKMP